MDQRKRGLISFLTNRFSTLKGKDWYVDDLEGAVVNLYRVESSFGSEREMNQASNDLLSVALA